MQVKKTRVESPTNPSYHYTPGSTINITSTDTFTATATSAFGKFLFQNKQRKEDLLGPYGKYFEEFKSKLPMLSGFRFPPLQSDFRTASLWEITESERKQEEEEEEESKDQEFTYQNPITENLEFETPNPQTQQNLNPENPEIKTPNIQTPPIQDNRNSKTINQQNLPPEIIINQPPIELIQPQPFQQPI
ncbi:hypothetical protein G9A89_008016 [Geosiphon pyriformis]|nr:hypothetical protein G9A89_008016 [Geosiphon pyriformis]